MTKCLIKPKSEKIEIKNYDERETIVQLLYLAALASYDSKMNTVANVRTNCTQLLAFTNLNVDWSDCQRKYKIHNYFNGLLDPYTNNITVTRMECRAVQQNYCISNTSEHLLGSISLTAMHEINNYKPKWRFAHPSFSHRTIQRLASWPDWKQMRDVTSLRTKLH